MATILAYTSYAIGHLFPMVPLLLELKSRGHTIHIRTLGSQVEHMRRLGLACEAVDSRIASIVHEDYLATSATDSLRHAARTFSRRGEIDGPDFLAAAEATNPDLAIVDFTAWGAASAVESLGIPWVCFEPGTPVLNAPGTPPFGPGLAPMSGPVGRIRDAIVRRMVIGAVEKTYMPAINQLRAQYRLDPVANVDELFRKAPLMIVTTAKPFEYEVSDWGPNVIMVGACAWEPPAENPEWLGVIDRPIALVTTSSEFQNDARLVEAAFNALASEPLHIVATVPAGSAASFTPPGNATVVEYVAHSQVLPKAAVAITHGGMGATQKALSFGIPVCVVPFGRDQFEVARRVEVSKSGTMLPAKKLTPERLHAAVKTAMTMKPGAERVARGYLVTGSAAAGADAVEQRLLRSLIPGHSMR